LVFRSFSCLLLASAAAAIFLCCFPAQLSNLPQTADEIHRARLTDPLPELCIVPPHVVKVDGIPDEARNRGTGCEDSHLGCRSGGHGGDFEDLAGHAGL
jgi:hypothetical protein